MRRFGTWSRRPSRTACRVWKPCSRKSSPRSKERSAVRRLLHSYDEIDLHHGPHREICHAYSRACRKAAGLEVRAVYLVHIRIVRREIHEVEPGHHDAVHACSCTLENRLEVAHDLLGLL